MKKMMFLLACVLTLATVNSCSNKAKKTPGESAKEYAKHIQDGNYDGFVDYIYFDDIDPATVSAELVEKPAVKPAKAEVKKRKAVHAKVLKENVQPYIEQNEGIKNVTVKVEEIASGGNTANVTLNQEYNNGQVEDVTYDMVLVDNDWKVRVGNNKEVWKTTLADGTDLRFTLKENDRKDVIKEHMGNERDFIKEKETENKYVEKVKEDGHKEVLKVKDKENKVVIKEKFDGEKTVTEIEKIK